MGVLNINSDSFNPKSRINELEAIEKITQMINDGADYIDIGGVSSRPGSVYCGKEEEFRRIKNVVEEIYRQNLHEKVKFSLDSFDEYCLEFALNHGFTMINDISANENLAKLAANYNSEYCLMHMQGSPQDMQSSPHYDDLLGEIDEFFAAKLEFFRSQGVQKIVLDPGIGFGKTAQQNLLLIKHLQHFTHFGCAILIGASAKSLINFYSPSEVGDRLAGSLYLHLKACENGANIIRTHDVAEHRQLFNLHEAMNGANLW
ncbi:MAG: dihydropteroate synthase [Campylobacter sp.]|nr:dihydropteroate synthase [Campylobacter sp.]